MSQLVCVCARELGWDTATATKVEHHVPGLDFLPEPGHGAGPGHPYLTCLLRLLFLLLQGGWQLLPLLLPTFLFCFPQNSVTRSAPVNSDSQGRCGARFLTTYDRRFVIKAVSSEDVAEMHNILKKYHQVGGGWDPGGGGGKRLGLGMCWRTGARMRSERPGGACKQLLQRKAALFLHTWEPTRACQPAASRL